MERISRSVRPVLTLVFAACLVYMALTGKVSVDFVQGVFAGAINYWFAERAALASPDEKQTS
jgi:hypothetical protein